MKNRLYLTFLIGLFFIALSCEDHSDGLRSDQITDEKITDARDYFESEIANKLFPAPSSGAREGGSRKSLIKNAVWNKAYVRKLSFGETVVIPLSFPEERYIAKGNSSLFLSELSYAMIYKDEQGK